MVIQDSIVFFLSNFTLSFFILGLLASALALLWTRPLSRACIIDIFFRYFLLFSVGFSYFYNFIMHCFFGDLAAQFIGWAQSPFQFEVGMASLGVAICGFLAFRASWPFRAATLIVPIVFNWGAALGHAYQMITAHNFAPGNAGIMFWSDLIFPVISILFLVLSRPNRIQ